jgi:hypothetical protein
MPLQAIQQIIVKFITMVAREYLFKMLLEILSTISGHIIILHIESTWTPTLQIINIMEYQQYLTTEIEESDDQQEISSPDQIVIILEYIATVRSFRHEPCLGIISPTQENLLEEHG